MPAGILFGFCMMLIDGEGRERILKVAKFQDISLLTVIILMFIFMIYRTWILNSKFRSISIDADFLIFPSFSFWYQKVSLRIGEIQNLRQNELGVAILTPKGTFLIKKRYFQPGKFEEFNSILSKKLH